MSKRNAFVFVGVSLFVFVVLCLSLYVGGGTWTGLAGSSKVGLVLISMMVIVLVSMGTIGLMEADNETNPTDARGLSVHYLKLVGSLLLIMMGITLVILVFVPLGFHSSVQGIVPLYGMRPYKTPLVKVLDKYEVEVEVDVVDPKDPTKTVKMKKKVLVDSLELVTIDASSLPMTEAVGAAPAAPVPGDIHVTIVVDREEAVKSGFLVPKKRLPGAGEVWFQDKNKADGSRGEKQSWVAPF